MTYLEKLTSKMKEVEDCRVQPKTVATMAKIIELQAKALELYAGPDNYQGTLLMTKKEIADGRLGGMAREALKEAESLAREVMG